LIGCSNLLRAKTVAQTRSREALRGARIRYVEVVAGAS